MKNFLSNFRKNSSTNGDAAKNYTTITNNNNNNNSNGINNNSNNNSNSNNSVNFNPNANNIVPNNSNLNNNNNSLARKSGNNNGFKSFQNSGHGLSNGRPLSSSLASIGSSWTDPNRLEMVREEEILLDMYNNSANNNNSNNSNSYGNNDINNRYNNSNINDINNKNTGNVKNKKTNVDDNINNIINNHLNNNRNPSLYLTTPKPYSLGTNKFSSINPKNQVGSEPNQNFQKAPNSTNLVQKSSEQSRPPPINDQNDTGIIHLSTRIITDDVPPRLYGIDNLRSESVISLINATAFPAKTSQSLSVSAQAPTSRETTTNQLPASTGGSTTSTTAANNVTVKVPDVMSPNVSRSNNEQKINGNSKTQLLLLNDLSNANYETSQTSFLNSTPPQNNNKKYAAPQPPQTSTTTTQSSQHPVTNDTKQAARYEPIGTETTSLTVTKPAPRFDISAFERGKLPNLSATSNTTISKTSATPTATTTTLLPQASTTTASTTTFSSSTISKDQMTFSHTPTTPPRLNLPQKPPTPLTPTSTSSNSPDRQQSSGLPVFFNTNNVDITSKNISKEDMINSYTPGFSSGFHIGLPTFFRNSMPFSNQEQNQQQMDYTDNAGYLIPNSYKPDPSEATKLKTTDISKQDLNANRVPGKTKDLSESNLNRKPLIRSYESKISPKVDSKLKPINLNDPKGSTKLQSQKDISNQDSKSTALTQNDSTTDFSFKTSTNNIQDPKQKSVIKKDQKDDNDIIKKLDINANSLIKTTAIDDVSLDSTSLPPQDNKPPKPPISKLNIPTIFNNAYNSNLNKKSPIDIPQNNFIRNEKFINHLENVIAKSATSSLAIKASPQNANQKSVTDKPKFKFLVEGIDIPEGSLKDKSPEVPDSSVADEFSSTKSKKEPKGFSYIKDKKLAEQVTKLAAEVTARKPHESVEHLNSEKEVLTHGENDFMIEARKKLHAHLNGLKRFQSTESLVEKDGQMLSNNNNFSQSFPNVNFTNLDDERDLSDGLFKLNYFDKTNKDPKRQQRYDAGRRHKTESNIEFNDFKYSNNNISKSTDKLDLYSIISTDSHNIPHDTSRIFLRPHNNDFEQLKKLEDERNQTLKRRKIDANSFKKSDVNFNNQFPGRFDFTGHGSQDLANEEPPLSYRGTYEEINSNFMSSSSEQSKDERSISSGRYEKSKNSSTPSMKQLKIRQKAKIYNNNNNFNSKNNNDNDENYNISNAHSSDDQYLTYTNKNNTTNTSGRHTTSTTTPLPVHRTNYNRPGMISPVLQAGARTVSRLHMNVIDDAYNITGDDAQRNHLKQKKTNTRGNIKNSKSLFTGNEPINNVNNDLNLYEISSDYSDDNSYDANKIKNKNRNHLKNLSKRYGSESDLTIQTRRTPGSVTVGIKSGNNQKVSAFQVRNGETPLKGFITVDKLRIPSSTSLNIPNAVSGELTLLKEYRKLNGGRRDRSRTLTASGITIGGPKVYLTNLPEKQSNINSNLLISSNYLKNSVSLHDIASNQNYGKKLISDPIKITTLNRLSTKKISIRDRKMHGYDTITRSLPTLETASVDPELEKVGKSGNQYRIQLKLNAALPDKHGVMSGRQSRLTNTSFMDFNQDKFRPISGPMYSSNFVEYDDGMVQVANNLSLNYASPPPPPPPPLSFYHSPTYYKNNQIDSLLSLQVSPPPNVLTTINQSLDNADSFAIKSITASKPVQNIQNPSKVEFQLELLPSPEPLVETYSVPHSYQAETTTTRKAKPPRTQQHDYNMTVNDTMRLEYEPPTKLLEEDFTSKSKTRPNPLPPDVTDGYLQPTTYSNDNDSGSFPKIVRGSILIRNSLDRETGRRYLNALNSDRNKSKNNLFHAKYHQRRENPAYSSDFENLDGYSRSNRRILSSDYTDAGTQQVVSIPTIAQDWDETDYRSVPINRDWYHEYLTGSKLRSDNFNKKSGAWKLKSSRTKEMSSSNGGAYGNFTEWHEGSYGLQINRNIRQSVDVKREEEQVIGPVTTPESKQEVETALNVDAVSEKVELSLSDGIVTIEVKVRCERLVPIRGTSDMFRKSAVVVTRKIEIDMMVTPERKQMYETAVTLSKRQQGLDENSGKGSSCLRLSTKDTFELYCKLMEMADKMDGPEEGMLFGSVHIDKELEEDKRLPYGATSAEALITNDNLLSPESSKYHRARTRLS